MTFTRRITQPLIQENPVTVQILGLCSALAVSRTLEPALIMAVSVVAVLVFANLSISLLRNLLPHSVRLILEVTIVASAVIVVDEVIRTFAPHISEVLSVFVGLIITNCIILGRAESFAMHHRPLESVADALGNGMGYAGVLLVVAAARELAGTGALLGYPLLPMQSAGGWYRPNEMMQLAPSAFFLIGFLIWGLRSWRGTLVEQSDHPSPRALHGGAK